MPEANITATVYAPVDQVWEYVKNIDNWAAFVQGYESHQFISDVESNWFLKGVIGGIPFDFEMMVWITEWKEKEKVSFKMEGLLHPVKGYGQVILMADEFDLLRTDIILNFKIHGTGLVRPIVNYSIGPQIKPSAERLLEKIKSEIEKTGQQ